LSIITSAYPIRKEISALKADLETYKLECQNVERLTLENTNLSRELASVSAELSTTKLELARIRKDYEPLKKVNHTRFRNFDALGLRKYFSPTP
jgi:hypothetical protein